VQKFAAGLLDVVDNLERAMESVPKEVLTQGVDPETSKPISADRALSILRSFVDGIKLTYDIFVKVRSCACLACMRSEVRKQHSARPFETPMSNVRSESCCRDVLPCGFMVWTTSVADTTAPRSKHLLLDACAELRPAVGVKDVCDKRG
jgi:hypothetical protein